MSEWIKKLTEAYAQQNEAMDPVNKAELKGKHKDRKDKDIDNDGDVDSSDEYLHKRRKAISKEGNAFTKALMAARKAGDKTFMVGGKSYSCEDYDENGKLKEALDDKDMATVKKVVKGLKGAVKAHGSQVKSLEKDIKDDYNEPQGQAKRMMSPLQKMRMDKEKKDRDHQGKMKPGVMNKMKKEAYEGVPKATHKGHQDPQGVGLSPSAAAQLKNKQPTPEPMDASKVNAKNFKDFRKGMKTAAKRNGDNDKGDKNIVK